MGEHGWTVDRYRLGPIDGPTFASATVSLYPHYDSRPQGKPWSMSACTAGGESLDGWYATALEGTAAAERWISDREASANAAMQQDTTVTMSAVSSF